MRSGLPKVLHKIAGQSMLSHVVGAANKLNPEKIIVVVGHGADKVKEDFTGQNIDFVYQAEQLGTAHAVNQAMPLVDDSADCLVLYGDVPLIRTETLAGLLKIQENGLALLTENMSEPYGYGRIVRAADGSITRIVEQKDANTDELQITEVNTGILSAPAGRLKGWLAAISNDNAQGEYYLTDVVSLAAKDKASIVNSQPVFGWETMGVNSRLQQAKLERLWQAKQAEDLLDNGVSLADPARLDLRGSLQCGKDVFIDVGCVFSGQVKLGDGVHIGPYCVISDTSIGAGSQVDAFSHIAAAEVATDTKIGPYARLRPGANIGANAHVGNFVEIKNSTLGVGSKANHLSYIGDAQIGNNVNIGAGTITCNYDGVNKYQTVIEDDAFIGSDTQLVAPVLVGKGATIGAGTTLTKDAPAQQLTLSRAKQLTVKNWISPVAKQK